MRGRAVRLLGGVSCGIKSGESETTFAKSAVQAEGAATEGYDLQQATGNGDVLQKVDQLVLMWKTTAVMRVKPAMMAATQRVL